MHLMKAHKTRFYFIICFITMSLISGKVMAASGWSWGFGYHNPPNATLGLNFMHLWSQWAFELGLGYVNSSENDSSNDTNSSSNQKNVNVSIAGDLNLKYLFGSGSFRPYIQGGSYAGVSAQGGNQTGANASLNGGFLGLGFFIMSSSVDFYISYITAGKGSLQLGLNF